MPKGMTAIFSQTVTSTVSNVYVNNIPQNYTDLRIIVSGRSTNSNATYYDAAVYCTFNNNTGSVYSSTRMYGVGSGGAGTDRITNATSCIFCLLTANETAANIFSAAEVHIPNYSGTGFKQFITNTANENNTTNNVTQKHASLFRSNTPITSIQIGGTWVSGSTITVYGISR